LENRQPKPETLQIKGDFSKFTEQMKRLMAVPYREVKAALDAEDQARKRKRGARASSRASHVRG